MNKLHDDDPMVTLQVLIATEHWCQFLERRLKCAEQDAGIWFCIAAGMTVMALWGWLR